MTAMDTSKVNALQAQWIAEASDSDLGLWWLARDVQENLDRDASDDDTRTWTLRLLQPLLRNGAITAVDLLPGGGFVPWRGNVEEQIERIDAEWRALGRQPALGEIVWFIGPRQSSGEKPTHGEDSVERTTDGSARR